MHLLFKSKNQYRASILRVEIQKCYRSQLLTVGEVINVANT
jgi:hypothetical protein